MHAETVAVNSSHNNSSQSQCNIKLKLTF